MSDAHITLTHLTSRGWQIVSNTKYTHGDGRTLEREGNGRWYVRHGKKAPKYVGSTLRVAIQTIIGASGVRG